MSAATRSLSSVYTSLPHSCRARTCWLVPLIQLGAMRTCGQDMVQCCNTRNADQSVLRCRARVSVKGQSREDMSKVKFDLARTLRWCAWQLAL